MLRFRDTAKVKTGKTQATLINFGRTEDKYTMDSTRATGAKSTMNAAMSTTHMIFDMPAPTNAESGLDAMSANAHTDTPRQIRARKIRMKNTSHARLSDICNQNLGRSASRSAMPLSIGRYTCFLAFFEFTKIHFSSLIVDVGLEQSGGALDWGLRWHFRPKSGTTKLADAVIHA